MGEGEGASFVWLVSANSRPTEERLVLSRAVAASPPVRCRTGGSVASVVSCEPLLEKKGEGVFPIVVVANALSLRNLFLYRRAVRRSGHVIELDMKFKCRSGIGGKNRSPVLRCLASCIPCHLRKLEEIGSLASYETVKIQRGKIQKMLPLKYPVHFREIIASRPLINLISLTRDNAMIPPVDNLRLESGINM